MASAPRIRRVGSRKEMETLIDDFITQEYSIVNQGEKTALVIKDSNGTVSGHVITFLFTAWFSFGLGNLVYWLIARKSGDKVMIKLDEEE